MKYPLKILVQTIVKSFYKENAGFFIFLITLMFCIVNKVDGAGVIEYHYSLILGMLKNIQFLLLIFLMWFLYVRKISAFVLGIIHKPEYSFLSIFNGLSKSIRFRLFLIAECFLLLPVLLYAFFILVIGWQQHFYLQISLVILYLFLLSIGTAKLHIHVLYNPHKKQGILWRKYTLWQWPQQSYPLILLRFISTKQNMIWLGIKVFTCGTVFLIARNNTQADYDLSFPFLFFNFGILANSILVYRIREFENTYLWFYRGLPVSLLKRILQYAGVYFIVLIPEYIVFTMLVPVHIKYMDSIYFIVSAYCLLLLMNSITYLIGLSIQSYFKILFIIFCFEFILILTVGFVFLPFVLLLFAILFFVKEYYKFEPGV